MKYRICDVMTSFNLTSSLYCIYLMFTLSTDKCIFQRYCNHADPHPTTQRRRSSQNHRFRPRARRASCQLNRLYQASKRRNRIADTRPVSAPSVYIAEMNAMTTIRFRNIAYSAPPFSHTRARPTDHPLPFIRRTIAPG